MTAFSEPLWFDAELRPHRSLSRKAYGRIMGVFMLVCMVGGARAWVIGAWPVAAFLVLDVLLLWGAFKLSYMSGRAREVVRLSRSDLQVSRYSPFGPPRHARFEPYWTRVEIRHAGEHRAQVRLRDAQNHTVIASFLPKEERTQLGWALKDALQRLRDNQPPLG